jgi:hypothetical protein
MRTDTLLSSWVHLWLVTDCTHVHVLHGLPLIFALTEMMCIPGIEGRLRCFQYTFAIPDKLQSATQVSAQIMT